MKNLMILRVEKAGFLPSWQILFQAICKRERKGGLKSKYSPFNFENGERKLRQQEQDPVPATVCDMNTDEIDKEKWLQENVGVMWKDLFLLPHIIYL